MVRGEGWRCLVRGEGWRCLVMGEGWRCLVRGEGWRCLVRGEAWRCLVRGDVLSLPIPHSSLPPPPQECRSLQAHLLHGVPELSFYSSLHRCLLAWPQADSGPVYIPHVSPWPPHRLSAVLCHLCIQGLFSKHKKNCFHFLFCFDTVGFILVREN